MKVSIHIGAHKTGSTAIQRSLMESRGELKKIRTEYPEISWFQFGHHGIPFSLKGMVDPGRGSVPSEEKELGQLSAFLSSADADHVILSSEEFFSLNDTSVEKLHDRLAAYEVQVIAYARRQDDFFLSAYNQQTKQPGAPATRAIDEQLAFPDEVTSDLDMNACLGVWEKWFGLDNTKLLMYEEGDVLSSFEQALDLPPLWRPMKKNGPINSSTSPMAAEIVRVFKMQEPSIEQQHAVLREAIARYPMNGGNVITAEQRHLFLKKYQTGNQEMLRRHGFRGDEYDPNPVNRDAMETSSVTMFDADEISEILKSILSEIGV